MSPEGGFIMADNSIFSKYQKVDNKTRVLFLYLILNNYDLERVEKVRKHRLESKAKTTRQYAANPTLFAQRPQPEGCDFIIVPRVTSKSK